MKFTTSDKVNLFYTDTGEGRPIVCLPGIGASHWLWQPLTVLLKKEFRVIVLDPRNQGLSDRTYKGQRISRHALDLAEFLEALQIKDAIAIGNSMGAGTLFAYLSLFGSKRLSAIVDLDQSPKMISDTTWPYGFKELTWSNFPDYMKLDMGPATVAPLDFEVKAKARLEYQKIPYDPDQNYDFLIDHSFQDWRDVILDAKLPILFVAGGKSPYFNPKFASVAAQLNDHAESCMIPDCGHVIQLEKPKKLKEVLLTFLNKHQLV